MSTRFTALTIKEGDAFLLEDNGWNCLFDSGKDGSIVDLLRYKGIDKLDLAICSHNDKDHAQGFIELLESGFQIDEIWLPGLWASVLQFVKENRISDDEVEFEEGFYNGKLESLFSKESVSCESFNQKMSILEEMKDLKNSSQLYDRIHGKLVYRLTTNPRLLANFLAQRLQDQFNEGYDEAYYEAQLRGYLKDLIDDNLFNWYLRSLSRSLANRLSHHSLSRSFIEASFMDVFRDSDARDCLSYDLKNSIDIKLNRIINIVVLARQHGCTIRWFEPTSECSIKAIDYGFVSLNSSMIGQIKKPRNSVAYFYALSLTKENRYSLVFEYTKKEIPIIRFSADSKSTCQSKSYKKNIIVTAPHHGSYANSVVYRRLNGNDIIWVRSDERSDKRPCPGFKKQPNKYCLACNKYNFVSEICFEYSPWDQKWHHVHGEQCRCKPEKTD